MCSHVILYLYVSSYFSVYVFIMFSFLVLATVYWLIYSWVWFDRVRRSGEVVVHPKKIYSNFRGTDKLTWNRFAVRCFAVLCNLQK